MRSQKCLSAHDSAQKTAAETAKRYQVLNLRGNFETSVVFCFDRFFFFFLINSLFGREAKMPRADQSASMMKFHKFSHSELVFVI